MKQTKFSESEKAKQKQLFNEGFFEDAENNGYAYVFDKTKAKKLVYSEHILKPEHSVNNLFPAIREKALKYFENNNIVWWGQYSDRYFPTGNLLSSQVHCLNHLFAIRQNPDAVLAMIKPLGEAAGVQFDKVLPSPIDKKERYSKSYISFEFVYENKDLIKEESNTRGAFCTSIDALVYAQTANGEKWLVPIEWKYTEAYDYDPQKAVNFGRYKDMVAPNSRLKEWDYPYRTDPFYELGRQTLLMEKIISTCSKVQADNFLHIIVVPAGNKEMNDDALTFRNSVKDEAKKYVRIITPEQLLSPVKTNYAGLFEYLEKRYWRAGEK